MKPADDLLEELIGYVQPQRGCAISLIETEPKASGEPNWTAIAGAMTRAGVERYGRKVAQLRQSDPMVDWSNAVVPPWPGARKQVTRWFAEAQSR